ncbi:uncharacterized protein Nmag_4130 (plasmid) [Natrialba magadii ATCC 43099]|uniref:Uncharacterized protein n=1 Tax=Natrialba magadii (strain ATCC 43099 / DSM 3394 / CCM 3739 / CIP 104546 / IAM 13178 / JCM 8861 / NBRC 102185 / NCIMB 2190 / MS3) TaxID=547559 RepID=D3T240_NATMM|nr:uncharacterized protein Nmag_4130 [Natrialba magadii ATCC 43099]
MCNRSGVRKPIVTDDDREALKESDRGTIFEAHLLQCNEQFNGVDELQDHIHQNH